MKRRLTALFLCMLMLVSIAVPCASAVSVNAHSGHTTQLEEILTGENCETDFCGRFFCEDCRESYYAPITYTDIGMPIINLEGSLSGVSKTNKVTVDVDYLSANKTFTSSATLKVQGGSSARYDKKNYTVQFLKNDGSKNKIALVDSWGKQSKYCLKANYVDFSQARNVVSGQLFNQIVHSRSIDDELNALPNGGVVDGYPVLVYLNGDLLGLYTMNIPKDNWMFGMNDETIRQALLFGDTWTDSVTLNSEIADVNDVGASGWEIEYCSTEDNAEIGSAWVGESMNEFIRFLKNNDGESFKNGISKYTDVDRAIDVLIFTFFIHANDNTSKNIVWASYDGVKWIPSVYDMDGTWGMVYNGSFTYSPTDFMPSGANLLFERLLVNYMDRITERYVELRGDILSKANIFNAFDEFFAKIPQLVYTAEADRWPDSPSHGENNISQIKEFTTARLASFDSWFGVTIAEKPDSAYKAKFNAPEGVKVLVYPSQDYTETPVQAQSAYSVTKDGELTKTDGQINFTVVPPENYEIASVTASPENYKNIKGPEETELDNTYRITKMTGDITVKIELRKTGADPDPEGYNVSFSCDHAKLYVYPSQDYSNTPTLSDTAVSADSESGIPTKSGEGQVNFLIVPDAGYAVCSVMASPQNYKNIKGPEETGLDNVYRITKISGDMIVSVQTEAIPEITKQPVSITAASGTTGKFSVAASGDGLSYRWQYQRPGSSTWTDSSATSGKTATLSVSVREAINGYKYRCIIKDANGKSATSAAAKLTVIPKISKQPADLKAKSGTTGKFTVTAAGDGLSYRWQYQKKGGTWTNSTASGANTATLRVSVREAINGYKYRCIVENSCGNTVTSSTAALTVMPAITKQPADLKAASGTTGKLSITATGVGLTYQWQYQKKGSSTWTDSSATSGKTATFSVSVREAINGCKYRCVIKDANGNSLTSGTASLTVTPNITKQPTDLIAASGRTGKLTVTAKGEGLSYRWQYMKPGSSTWTNSGAISGKTAAFSVSVRSAINGYKYRCVVKNSCGNSVTSSVVTLTVTPAITKQPADLKAASGTTGKFSVTADGVDLTYRWQYQRPGSSTWTDSGATSGKTARLSVNARSAINGYKYRCIVKDSNGNSVTSSTATLTVK